MKKPFGTFRWIGDTIYLDYRLEKRRLRPRFGMLRTNSAFEKQTLENEARLKLDEIERKIDSGQFFDILKNFPTYRQIALFYWEKWETLKPYMQERACNASEWHKLSLGLDFFGKRHANEIKREDIKSFRAHLRQIGAKQKRPWSDAYLNRLVSKVGQVYHQAINQEYWDYSTAPAAEILRYGNINSCVKIDNPTHGLSKLYEKESLVYIPTPEEFMLGWSKLIPAHRYLALIGIHTGLRKRNVTCLRWDQVNIFRKELVITSQKGRLPLILKLHEEVLDLLMELQKTAEDSVYVVHQPNGEPLRCFDHRWNQAWEEANMPRIRFKDLRTIYASWRVEEGAQLSLLQRAMGHTTPTTTGKHYNRTSVATDVLLLKQRSLLTKPIDQLLTETA